MDRLFFGILRLFIGLLVLAGIGLVFVYFVLTRSVPDYSETQSVTGLSGDVEIVRTNDNVPHIFGSDDEDVMFALGYAHAQDRLWQMTMMRRTAQGRLSELFGRETLHIDMIMRRLDLYGLARSSAKSLRPDTQAQLQAYSDGVNAWIGQINENGLGRGAPEFFLFTPEIAPWQPADSVAIVKVMGVQLAGHLQNEVLRARTSLMLGDDRLNDILPDSPGAGIAELPQYAQMFEGLPKFAENTHPAQPAISPFFSHELAGASNAWAANPSRSASQGSLLANDPHLGFSAPTVWYLARMQLESGDVIGATLPGTPAMLLGRSNNLGWGLTSSYLDDQDVYIEQINPKNPKEYKTATGFKPFVTRQSIVKIKDENPITLTLRWTDNGPVLPGSHYNLSTVTPPDHVTTIAWTLLSPNDTSIEAALDLMRAQTTQEAVEVSKAFIAPSQNLTLADRDSIVMRTIGAMPKRHPAHQTQGRLPTQGWLRINQWQGMFDQDSNPMFTADEGGLLGNTNNKVIDAPFPSHMSFVWGDTQRVQRWARLMQNRNVHTRDSFIEAQLDTVSPTARTLLPLIGKDMWFQATAAAPGSAEERKQQALALLANWNGEMNEHLPEPLIYSAWLRALQTRLIQDELGSLTEQYSHVNPVFIERVYRDVEGASKWCDVLQSAPIETCSQIASVAFDDALFWLEETYGNDVTTLRWGDAHEATHDHPVLGNVPLIRWIVNIRQSTSGGDNTLMRGRTSGDPQTPFQNVHGAGYRGVYDFADPDSSVFITSTGQSGHPLSRYYDNLGALWRRGEYIPMSLDPELARAGAIGTTVLKPMPQP